MTKEAKVALTNTSDYAKGSYYSQGLGESVSYRKLGLGESGLTALTATIRE